MISPYRRNYRDLTNLEFNGLRFIKEDGVVAKAGNIKWLIQCTCGNLFTTRSQRIFSRTTKSCGCFRRKFASENQKARIGPLHPLWNPFLTEEDRLRNRPEAAKRWALEVYKKDGYKCVVCQSSEVLNAHHLDGWNWCKDKRYDVDNGVTLCIGCHNDFHAVYGRGDNTKEQFQEFVKG